MAAEAGIFMTVSHYMQDLPWSTLRKWAKKRGQLLRSVDYRAETRLRETPTHAVCGVCCAALGNNYVLMPQMYCITSLVFTIES